MKRLPTCLVIIFLLVTLTAGAVDIHVSPNGADRNDGSRGKPLATITMALRKARELRRLKDPSVETGVHIILHGGTYTLYEPLVIRPEDAGNNTTFIEAAPGERPVLSGGLVINNWRKPISLPTALSQKAKDNVWVADVPPVNGSPFNFRQLWVNDVKAIRAKSVNGDGMQRILNWNKQDQSCWIPTPALPLLTKVKGMEMFIHQWWAIAVLRVREMKIHGDSTQLFFQQPESKIQSEHPWPAPWLSKETGNSAFYLVNAIQFLDEPGEWYLDQAAQKIYYWPRKGEDMKTANIVAPYLETLVQLQGTVDRPVSNIIFKGISFQHTGWLRPSLYGHVPHQAGMYMTEAYALKPVGTPGKPTLDNQAWIGRPAAAVEISFAGSTVFDHCRFEHLASTGLDYHKAVHNNMVKGNLFKDIGGSAILAGVYADAGQEIHLPYHPQDEREICDSMFISNNLVTNVTNEDWSCVGIGAGYTRNTVIEHNEIENVSYSGISMGWGWNAAPNPIRNNRVTANLIHHYGRHNYDCGGIYTLGAQPGSLISENYIDSICKAPYAHLPSHWFYLYTDEGSAGITVKNNWTPSQKYLQNANGPGNEWSNNGPQADQSIKTNAGLQPAYQWLGNERTAAALDLPVTEEHDELIELVVKDGKLFDVARLRQWLSQNRIDSNAVYQWQNHYVIFNKLNDVMAVQGRLKKYFPEAEVRVYHDLFYTFSKKKYCKDTVTATQWDHILLTANLVADKRLQQEYLDAHATQFEKWPEVARGFCNAGFQQLLVFRNGRQLMLVISIPKGESLDRLNPKTTENNPRVDEWNRLMKKYQEGTPGTKKDEVWVFLQKINKS